MEDTIKNKFKGEFRKVLIEQVSPNDWNPKESVEDNAFNKERYEQIKRNVANKSLYEPIKVRNLGPDVYQIVDGFHRWKACKELGYTEIMVWDFGMMSKEEAESITLDSIYLVIPPSEPLTAQIVDTINLTNPDALKLLPFTDLQIKEYIDMAHFDFNEYPDGEIGDGNKEEKMVECPQCHNKFVPSIWITPTEQITSTPTAVSVETAEVEAPKTE